MYDMQRKRNVCPAVVTAVAVATSVGIAAAQSSQDVVEPPPDVSGKMNGQGGASGEVVMPIVTTWKDVMARQQEFKRRRALTDPRSDSDLISGRDYNLYENAQDIIAARMRIAAAEQAAKEAIARGEQPVSLFGPLDPLIDHLDVGAPWAWPAQGSPLRAVREMNPLGGWDSAKHPGVNGGIGSDPSGSSPPSAPNNNINWQGIQDTSRPSDATCAVGPAHVGIMVNRELAFYTKDGTLVLGPVDFQVWWSSSPGPVSPFDPKIIYDNHVGRWVMLALDGSGSATETYYAMSFSQSSNPEGNWWTYYFRSDEDGSNDTAFWADYPGLGFDSGTAVDAPGGGGIYVTSNQYNSSNSFQYAKLRRLRKHQVFNGQGVTWWDFWNFSNDNGTQVFTWKPAMTSSGVTSGGDPVEYLLNTRSGGANFVTRWRLTDPLGSGPTLEGPTEVAVATYDVPPAGKQLDGGTTLLIDTNDCRTQDVQYRFGHLYMAWGDVLDWGTPSNVEAVLHYLKLEAFPATVVWDVRYGADDLYYSYPMMKADANSDASIIFSRYGAAEYAGIRVTGRLETDASTQGSAQVKAGEATYNPTGNTTERWGDYSGIDVDCAGDRAGVWVTSQYAQTSTAWDTWIAGTSFGATNVLHLNDGESSGFVSEDRYYTWEVRSIDWSGVSLYTAVSGDTDVAASTTCPFGTPYQYSTYGTDVHDFVVANGAQYGNEFHHARATYFNGNQGYRLEARNQSTDVSVGSNTAGAFTSSEIMDLYEAFLTSGETYIAIATPGSSGMDLDLFKFNGSRSNGRRADNDGSAQSNGAGVPETLVFTASESSVHGFAVINENFSSSDYTFSILTSCPWDCELVPDGQVGIGDFLLLLADWGLPSPCDFDGGGVGITDFLKLLGNWGPCP